MSYLRRIERALVHLTHARAELTKAREEISPIRGLVPMWEALGKIADRIADRRALLLRDFDGERLAKLNADDAALERRSLVRCLDCQGIGKEGCRTCEGLGTFTPPAEST